MQFSTSLPSSVVPPSQSAAKKHLRSPAGVTERVVIPMQSYIARSFITIKQQVVDYTERRTIRQNDMIIV